MTPLTLSNKLFDPLSESVAETVVHVIPSVDLRTVPELPTATYNPEVVLSEVVLSEVVVVVVPELSEYSSSSLQEVMVRPVSYTHLTLPTSDLV